MARFVEGAADVMVATTVIEVGIDVPNATVMVVEDAERYGISQLHQLRGRIGRGEHPSVCLLLGPRNARRLRALAEHSDGFRLAEIDLELRGEGEIAGTRQHGQAEPRVASLPQDAAAAGARPRVGQAAARHVTRRSRPRSTRCWAKRWSGRWARRPTSRSRRESGTSAESVGGSGPARAGPCIATTAHRG